MSCDQKVMWLYELGVFMKSHHLAGFEYHRLCGSGDMFLVVEDQDSTCVCGNPTLLFISKAHGAMLSHAKFQNIDIALCPGVHESRPLLVRRISSRSWRNTKKTSMSLPKNALDKKAKATAKCFALHANAQRKILAIEKLFVLHAKIKTWNQPNKFQDSYKIRANFLIWSISLNWRRQRDKGIKYLISLRKMECLGH